MKNRIFRNIDSQGRICIPYFLMELANLNQQSIVAFVTVGDDMVSIVEYEKAKDMPIIYKTKLDAKNRILIPKDLREGIEQVEVFLCYIKIREQMLSYFNIILHIFSVEYFLDNALVFSFIFSNFSGFDNKSFRRLSISSPFFIHIAICFSTKNSAFSSS